MAFVIKLLFLSACMYSARGGYLSGQQNLDSYTNSAQGAPSASYGPPSNTYGLPASSGSLNLGTSSGSSLGSSGHGSGLGSVSGPLPDYQGSYIADANLPAPLPSTPLVSSSVGVPAPVYGPPESQGSLNLDNNRLPPVTTQLGPPRIIGTTVTVGRPVISNSKFELQSVVQNVVRRIPVEVIRHVRVLVPQPIPVPVRQEIRVPVPQPYNVPVNVVKHVPYTVYKTQQVEVAKPVPYEVIKRVPVEVIKKVHVPVQKPYEVIKKVHVPIEKTVEVPYPVWKPEHIHIIKHVTHYKQKSCCW